MYDKYKVKCYISEASRVYERLRAYSEIFKIIYPFQAKLQMFHRKSIMRFMRVNIA